MTTLPHNFEFWKNGNVRCVLVVEKIPAEYVVRVLNHDTAVIYERCDTDEQAAALAAWFQKLFADQPL